MFYRPLLLTKVCATETFIRIKFWCYVKLHNSTIIEYQHSNEPLRHSCPLCRTTFSILHVCIHRHVPIPKTTVIGLGTRLVHMWHSESKSKTTVLQKSTHRQSTLQIAKVGEGHSLKSYCSLILQSKSSSTCYLQWIARANISLSLPMTNKSFGKVSISLALLLISAATILDKKHTSWLPCQLIYVP